MKKDATGNLSGDTGQQFPALIASMPASAQQRRIALGVIIFLSVMFVGVMPFARVQAARVDVFIPVVQSIICFADLMTAMFLFSQYSIQPRRALLFLASGYMFSGLFAFLQTLDFPGAYSASGLLSGGPSGAAWLFSFWHIAFPLAVIAYVALKDENERAELLLKLKPGRAIAITITCVFAVTAGLTWLSSADYLPALFVDLTRQALFTQYLAGAMWLLSAVAFALLFVRRRTILDIWLAVAVFVSLPDLGLSALFPVVRYSVGWYTARSYALIASCTVLAVLLAETTMLYARLASAIMLQRRESAHRLLTVDAATAAIAHELSQPLGAISLNSSAALISLESNPPDLEEARACLTANINDTERANEIVGSIRALFKMDSRTKTRVEVNRLVWQALRMAENDLTAHGVTVLTRFQEDLPPILADSIQLQHVFLNIIKNGIEAMAAGVTVVKEIQLVTGQLDNSIVCISVHDSGSGVASENETNIFDPFFTTKSSGLGLGLSISRKIIEDHGGNLRLTQSGANGCIFEITLPSVLSESEVLGRA